MASLLALASAAVWGAADFLGGFAARRASARSVALLATLCGFLAALAVLVLLGGAWSASAVVYGALAGLAGIAGLVLLFDAMASGKFQLVSPIAAVTTALVPVVAGLVLGDRPGPTAIVGLVVTAPAIWLLAGGTRTRPQHEDLRPLAKAFAAGTAFGVFFVLFAQTPDDSGAVPLVVAKGAATIALGIVAIARRESLMPDARRSSAVGSGVLDMVANGLFLAATRTGQLVVIGALAALFPVSNALLARVFLHERLTRLQVTGFAGAILAAALLSI